jgi:hypothetical protein
MYRIVPRFGKGPGSGLIDILKEYDIDHYGHTHTRDEYSPCRYVLCVPCDYMVLFLDEVHRLFYCRVYHLGKKKDYNRHGKDYELYRGNPQKKAQD